MSGLIRDDSATFKSAARNNAPLAVTSERDALQKTLILSSAAHPLSREGVSERAHGFAAAVSAAIGP